MDHNIESIIETFIRLSKNLTDKRFEDNPLNLHIVCKDNVESNNATLQQVKANKIMQITEQIAKETNFRVQKIKEFYDKVNELNEEYKKIQDPNKLALKNQELKEHKLNLEQIQKQQNIKIHALEEQLHKEQNRSAIDEMKAISLDDYAKAVGIKIEENENNANNLIGQIFSSKGFSVYHIEKNGKTSKHTIYIGFPYIASPTREEEVSMMESVEILPLDRVIWHEMGHHQQAILFDVCIENCDSNILEYHNIMSNENKSDILFGKGSKLGLGNTA